MLRAKSAMNEELRVAMSRPTPVQCACRAPRASRPIARAHKYMRTAPPMQPAGAQCAPTSIGCSRAADQVVGLLLNNTQHDWSVLVYSHFAAQFSEVLNARIYERSRWPAGASSEPVQLVRQFTERKIRAAASLRAFRAACCWVKVFCDYGAQRKENWVRPGGTDVLCGRRNTRAHTGTWRAQRRPRPVEPSVLRVVEGVCCSTATWKTWKIWRLAHQPLHESCSAFAGSSTNLKWKQSEHSNLRKSHRRSEALRKYTVFGARRSGASRRACGHSSLVIYIICVLLSLCAQHIRFVPSLTVQLQRGSFKQPRVAWWSDRCRNRIDQGSLLSTTMQFENCRWFPQHVNTTFAQLQKRTDDSDGIQVPFCDITILWIHVIIRPTETAEINGRICLKIKIFSTTFLA